jgi:fatty acid desaturase
MQLSPRSFYVRSLADALPAETFRPATSRLLWLPVHLLVIAAAIYAITRASSWPWQLLASLPIGVAFSGLAFLGHETLHGAVIKNRLARAVVGTICFLPFVLSTQLWVRWHGVIHHGNAQDGPEDPDAYPTIAAYRKSPVVRFMIDRFSPGGRRLTGVFSLLIGFTIQSGKLLVTGRKRGILANRREATLAYAGTAFAVAVWATLAVVLGGHAFLFAYVIPLLIGNAMVMGHILTNHGLSPLTEINDPLANSLTVTVPRWFRFITLGFGFHVEHHLYPAISTRHAGRVQDELRKRWPDRYRSLPLHQALLQLHRTARVYEDATTLCDPRSGQRWRIDAGQWLPISRMGAEPATSQEPHAVGSAVGAEVAAAVAAVATLATAAPVASSPA